MTETIIQTRDLTKQYVRTSQSHTALKDVGLSICVGEFVAIMGPSGSGKSTLLNLLGLLDTPSSGTYHLQGSNTADLLPDARAATRNRKIGFVFQGSNLLPRNTAFENVELPLVYSGIGSRERRNRVGDALANVGLSRRISHWPQALSGGEQQRVAIARAIVNQPALLLADEPTGALDTQTGTEILALFEQLHAGGTTIVIITHDPQVASAAGRVVYLRDGEVTGESAGVNLVGSRINPQ